MKEKRLAIVNSYNNGSTGTIACKIGDCAKENGFEVLKCFPCHTTNIVNKKEDQVLFGKPFLYKFNAYLTEITGLHGFFQFYNTKKLIKELEEFNPSIIHLHNLHSSYININMLFKYLKNNDIHVVWTLHDCWTFTGHCAHFTLSQCDKWKTGCYKCENHFKEYPKAFIDTSIMQWKRKKRIFNSVENLTLVTPSKWLNGLVKSSFLKDNNFVTIYNGVDLNVFKPTESDFRRQYNISNDKVILLGVAFGWNYRKGLDVFIELSKRLDDKYQIVLVGTDDNVDQYLPNNIISIHRTFNVEELVKIYSAADLFVNPTREEMLGMVNIEANACGTPVLTYNTGGSPECISEDSGYVCNSNTIEELYCMILSIVENNNYSSLACVNRARKFSQEDKYGEYVKLFNSILSGGADENQKTL